MIHLQILHLQVGAYGYDASAGGAYGYDASVDKIFQDFKSELASFGKPSNILPMAATNVEGRVTPAGVAAPTSPAIAQDSSVQGLPATSATTDASTASAAPASAPDTSIALASAASALGAVNDSNHSHQP